MVSSAKDREDMKRLIHLLMDTPYLNKQVFTSDMATSIESYKGKNTDVKTRILLGVVQDAVKGDLKSAEFLMKYGGYEPPKEQNITVDTPTIVDDMSTTDGEEAIEEVEDKIIEDAVIYDDPDVSEDD